MNNDTSSHNSLRIVLTGGPGAGKSTAADLLRREIGDAVVIVPEAATMLFSGGFPRGNTEFTIKATQQAIYHTQRNLEAVQSTYYPNRILLCDRGSIDCSVYWPEGPEHFFKEFNSSLEAELGRYDAVVFFETAAVGEINVIEGGNPYRNESIAEAIEIDRKLRSVWEKHPHFHFISHEKSFMKKMNKAHNCIQTVIKEHHKRGHC